MLIFAAVELELRPGVESHDGSPFKDTAANPCAVGREGRGRHTRGLPDYRTGPDEERRSYRARSEFSFVATPARWI